IFFFKQKTAYDIIVPSGTNGQWKIGLKAKNIFGKIPDTYTAFNLKVFVDDIYKGDIVVPASATKYRSGSFIAGLTSGVHRIKFLWINDYWVQGVYDANIQTKEVFFERINQWK
ncbi:MAG: hypothetical protein JW946_05510, partial [Candidatus Omnitrophica bacterium]|nr:hypothetical protein [Candidatus Omnitrophota bacterium]